MIPSNPPLVASRASRYHTTMLFQAPSLGIYIRIIAIVALFLGLNDASRLLGISMGSTSPISSMGFTAFAYLAVFSLVRLFAAVGLWLKASWGAVLLVGATVVELALYLTGSPDVRMTALGFAMRLILLAAISVVFALSLRFTRAQAD
ncbi:MAG: DUF2127 domain-containing protein [Phyllobacteriaceae bacterium]|nr:DUF2127 domain-containing protein [Phyllobacteriaceae bacterium]